MSWSSLDSLEEVCTKIGVDGPQGSLSRQLKAVKKTQCQVSPAISFSKARCQVNHDLSKQMHQVRYDKHLLSFVNLATALL